MPLFDSAQRFPPSATDAPDYALVGPVDNRVHEIHTDRFPFNTVCHLGRDFGDGLWRGCSGVLIGPRKVLTAAHCLYSRKRRGAPLRIRVAPGRSDRDSFPYGYLVAREYYVPRRFIRPRSAADLRAFDYGVILLPRAFPGIRRFLPLLAASPAALERLSIRELLTIAGYPGDRPVGTLWHHSERLRGATARRLLYSVDTCPGHSGSPIWSGRRRGKARIIGVHTSGILDARGRSHGCARGTVLAPPGMLNSGVRITPQVLADIRDPRRRPDGRTRMQRLP